MISGKHRIGILIIALVFIVSFSSLTFAEKWYEIYQRAIKAVEDDKCSSAVSMLNRLIIEEPTPKAGKRTYGTNFIDYYPYYYLGLCSYKQGNYRQAVQWLQRSNSAGAIREDDTLYVNLRGMLSDSQEKLAAQSTPVTTTPTLTSTTTTSTTTPAMRAGEYVSRGKEYYNKGQYDEAFAEFKKALDIDKDNREAQSWKDLSYSASRARELDRQGQDYERKGDYDRAIVSYQQASDLLPNDSSIKNHLLSARAQKTKSASQASTSRMTAMYNDAKKAYDSRDYVTAKVKFEQVLKENPNHKDARLYLDETNKKLLAASGPKDTRTQIKEFIEKANNALGSNQLVVAKANIEAALALDSRNKEAKNLITDLKSKNKDNIKNGLEAYLKGDINAALNVLTSSLEIDDSSAGLLAFVGSLNYSKFVISDKKETKLQDNAAVYFKKAISLDPKLKLDMSLFTPEVIDYFESLK